VCCPVQLVAARTHACPPSPILFCRVATATPHTGAHVSIKPPNPRPGLEGCINPEHHPTIAPLAIMVDHPRAVVTLASWPRHRLAPARTHRDGEGAALTSPNAPQSPTLQRACKLNQFAFPCTPWRSQLLCVTHRAVPHLTAIFVPSTGRMPNLVAVFLPDTPSPAHVHFCTSASRCYVSAGYCSVAVM
jgi:hypothetical protein